MGKLVSIIKKGYYGNVVTVMFREKEIVRFYRSQTGERIFLFGKKFWKRSIPERYLLKNGCNNASIQACGLDDIVRQSKKTVVFVIDSIEDLGGVETRLYHEACYMKSIGYEPIIVTKYDRSDKLREFCNILLDYKAPNFTYWLDHIVRKAKPVFVEFHFKGWKYLHDVNIANLKEKTIVGACIHGIYRVAHSLMRQFDYRVYSCANDTNRFEDAHHVPNFIRATSQRWSYKKQSTALFISRISEVKLKTLDNFIKICKQNNIAYKIAGPIDHTNPAVAKYVSCLEDDVLIGGIDTYKYLTEHGDDYLFVGGIGQVPIEAASFGIPALILSSRSEEYSTFLTADKMAFFIKWNFVINECPKEGLGNADDFFHDVARGEVSQYSLGDEINSMLSVDSVMKQHMDVIKNSRKDKQHQGRSLSK